MGLRASSGQTRGKSANSFQLGGERGSDGRRYSSEDQREQNQLPRPVKRRRPGWSAVGNRSSAPFFSRYDPTPYPRPPSRMPRIVSAATSMQNMRAHSVKTTENAARLAKERRDAKIKREKEARRWIFHAKAQSNQQALEVKKKLAEMAKSTARLEKLKPPKAIQKAIYAQKTEERNKFEEMRSQSLKQMMLPPTGPFIAEPAASGEAVPAPEEGNDGRGSAARRDSQPTIAAVAPAASAVPASPSQAPPITINTSMLIAESVERLSKSRAEE